MRIGINTLFLVPGDVGGTEIYLRENLKEMVNLEPETDFVVFTTRDNEAVFRTDLLSAGNVAYVQLPFRAKNRPIRILAEQILLPLYVRKSTIDVLWSPGYTAPLHCPCPQVVTIHDLQYKTHPDDLSLLERKTLDFLVSSACRTCEGVITVSEFSRQEVIRYDFAPKENITAVLEGVDPTFASSNPGTVHRVEQLPPEPYILCVAHTYPHKNVHVLVEAFGKIADRVPHHLVLVGTARRGEGRVRKSLAALHCQDRVHRLSSLGFAELTAVYRGADVFVLPSEYEGFGLPILEAMLAGIPVITTNKASLPEVGGAHAVYVQNSRADELSAALLDVVSWNQKERQTRTQNAQAWASAFTWQKSAMQTMQVLKGVYITRQS